MFHLNIFQDTSIVIYVFRYTYICLCVSAHCGSSVDCCCQGLIYFLRVLVYKCFQGETFCDCPSQRAAGCIVYRDIMLPPSLWGLWQCCSVLCSACSPLSTQSEAGSQQDLDAQQACPGSAEAMVCSEGAQSGTDPLSPCGGSGFPSVLELGVGWAWGEMLPLGYRICSFACMQVAEDPSVLLVRMLCNPSALHSNSCSCWLPAGVSML